MTSRLLASFNELDKYSKEVLNKYSRKNKLNHGEKCSTTSDEIGLSSGVKHDWAYDMPCKRNPSKLNFEIIKEKNSPSYKQRNAKCTPRPSHKEPRSAQTVCSKVCICPFTSTKELAQRTDNSKDKDTHSDGFMVVRLNKPQSLVSRKYALHRTRWSREVEQLAPMDVHLKYRSTAQTGGALNYTNTSHWSSSSNSGHDSSISAFTEEENGHFTLPGSVGKVVVEQLQHGNIVRVTTSGKRSEENSDIKQLSTEGEPLTQSLPLCFDDELERNPAKVLSPRAPTTYTPMPIASETFPVVYNTGQPHNKPFSSSGFHTLDPTAHPFRNGTFDIRGSKVHSAIIRLTDITQENHAVRLQHKPASRWNLHDYQRPPVDARSKHVEQRLQSGNLRVLSVDGTLVMPTDEDRLHVTSPASGKSMDIPFVNPKQWCVSLAPVDTVLNGLNPKQNSRYIIRSPDDIKLPYSGGKTKAIIHGHPRPEAMTSNKTSVSLQQKNKMGFVYISKPLMPPKSSAYQCLSQHGLQKRVWHQATTQPFHGVVMSSMSDDLESVGNCVGLFACRPNSYMNSEVQNRTVNTPNSLDDQKECSECIGSRNKDYQKIINIPTAEDV